MVDIPAELLRRIASAKAKAFGEEFEEISPFSVDDGEPVALPEGVQPSPEAPAKIPEELLEREAASREATLAALPPAPARNTVPKKVAPKAEPLEPVAVPQTQTVAPPTPEAVPTAVPAADVTRIPEKLLRRSAEAKAKASGRPIEEVLAEMSGGAAPVAAAPVAAAAVVEAPVAAVPVVEVPVAAAAPAAGVASLAEAAASLGMPEKLLRRSAEAKAKALGVPVEQVLADMLGVSAPVAAAPVAAAAVVEAPVAAVPVVEVPIAAVAAPEGPTPIPVASAVSDEVDPWPALFKIEFFTAIIAAAFLALLALAGPAPLFEPASGVVDPSKAPWYLLWMQRLLAWLHPQVAGFYLPLLILVGLFAVPFIEDSREDRRVGLLVFGIFTLVLVVLTILGFASRSSGFGYPWIVG